MLTVLMVDAQEVLRRGLRLLLKETNDLRLVDDVGSLGEMFQLLAKNPYDLLLVDSEQFIRDTLAEELSTLRACYPHLELVFFSADERLSTVKAALSAGASAYIVKSSPIQVLLEGLRKVAGGDIVIDPTLAHKVALAEMRPGHRLPHERLSLREREIFQLLAHGNSVTQIGKLIYRSHKTVSTHKARLMQKMGFNSTVELVRYALKHQLI